MLADIMKAALKYADRPAFVIEDETYTYSRLVGQALSISHTLRNLKENVVGIAAENRIETYASILAVLLAGKTYVILHPDYPAERKRQIARQAGIGLLLYGPEGNTVLPPDVAERAVFQSQLALLNDIADLLNRHHCRVRILISPDYNQKVLHPKDKEILCKLFGEANVFDFSGINEYTNDYHYYYEQGHYRPLLGKKLMERIYGHSL